MEAIMTNDDIQRVIAHIEKTWKSRTPATRIDDVDASYRVGRGEVRLWCSNNNIKLDEFDDAFNRECKKLFKRLKKEYPNEMWSIQPVR